MNNFLLWIPVIENAGKAFEYGMKNKNGRRERFLEKERSRRPGLLVWGKNYRRRRLSHRTESRVPRDWKICTRMTSSAVATTMMRYLYL